MAAGLLAVVATGGAVADAASERVKAASKNADQLSAQWLFTWANRNFRELFPDNGQSGEIALSGTIYYYRYFPATSTYLAVSGRRAYALGPLTGGALQDFGPVATLECAVTGRGCAAPPKPRSNCSSPGAEQLLPGVRPTLNYRYSGSTTGRVTTATTVDDQRLAGMPGNVMRSVTTYTSQLAVTGGSGSVTGRLETFFSLAPDDTVYEVANLKEETTVATPTGGKPVTTTTSTRTDFTAPGLPDNQNRMVEGDSLTVTMPQTVTQAGTVPKASTFSRTYYLRDATARITVLGKTYDTCQFNVVVDGRSETWYHEHGTGVLVKGVLEGNGRSTASSTWELEP